MLLDLRAPCELAHGARDVADAPAAAGDDHHAPLLGQARARAAPATGQRGSRNSAEISGRTSCTLPAPGDALDRRHRLAVHHQVHVDARLRPEEQARQVGDRRDRRAAHLAGAAQPREHDRHGRVGRDDDVGFVLGDRARQRARAEQAQQPPREHADRQHVLEQPVDDRVGPRDEAQLHAVAVLDDRAAAAAHRREPVDHGDLGVLRRESSICSASARAAAA